MIITIIQTFITKIYSFVSSYFSQTLCTLLKCVLDEMYFAVVCNRYLCTLLICALNVMYFAEVTSFNLLCIRIVFHVIYYAVICTSCNLLCSNMYLIGCTLQCVNFFLTLHYKNRKPGFQTFNSHEFLFLLFMLQEKINRS